MKTLLQHAYATLDGTIRLWVIARTHSKLDTEQRHQLAVVMRGEAGVAVRNNYPRVAVLHEALSFSSSAVCRPVMRDETGNNRRRLVN